MKKPVSLRTQSILSFVPVVNVAVLHIWIYNYYVAVRNHRIFVKSLLVLFATVVPLGILLMALAHFFTQPQLVSAINLVAIYVIPLFMARGLICFQKRCTGEIFA